MYSYPSVLKYGLGAQNKWNLAQNEQRFDLFILKHMLQDGKLHVCVCDLADTIIQ